MLGELPSGHADGPIHPRQQRLADAREGEPVDRRGTEPVEHLQVFGREQMLNEAQNRHRRAVHDADPGHRQCAGMHGDEASRRQLVAVPYAHDQRVGLAEHRIDAVEVLECSSASLRSVMSCAVPTIR